MSAKCYVSADFLLSALKFPHGTKIVGAIYNSHYQHILLDVEHDSIPANAQEVRVICQSVACHFEPIT